MTIKLETTSELTADLPAGAVGLAAAKALVRPAILALDELKPGENQVIQVNGKFIVGLGGVSAADDETGPAILHALSLAGYIPQVQDVARMVIIESPSGNAVALIEAQ